MRTSELQCEQAGFLERQIIGVTFKGRMREQQHEQCLKLLGTFSYYIKYCLPNNTVSCQTVQ